MMTLSSAEQQTLRALLRDGENLLWMGKGASAPAARKSGFWSRLFRKNEAAAPEVLYAVTSKRVLALQAQDGEVQEWFLMLGLVQAVNELPGGSGDIVFDYQERDGQKEPCGLIGIPAVAQVRNLLNDAIDAAYNASPWSV